MALLLYVAALDFEPISTPWTTVADYTYMNVRFSLINMDERILPRLVNGSQQPRQQPRVASRVFCTSAPFLVSEKDRMPPGGAKTNLRTVKLFKKPREPNMAQLRKSA